jgi:EmrB/QacA subfamily drug resistance transporter
MTAATPAAPPFLATRHGKLTLALLCAVAFLDFADAAIVNVALPSIRQNLHFSVQSLQWVVSGYVLTYGGFLLLGGRAADLLGRRRLLVAGTSLFGLSSLAAGFAGSEGVLVGARLVQGVGAAMMAPAALSILTTSFHTDDDRRKALGAWGGMAGFGSAAGALLGGVLSQALDWRWVFFVNLPVCVAVIAATFALLADDRRRASFAEFDALGALVATGGMLLLVYTLVKAPDLGWGDARTLGGLAGAGVLLAAFLAHERRHAHPLVPLSIFRIKGLGAADATQVLATAGFLSTFFFVTLYMQNVLGFSQLGAGMAYLPTTIGIGVASGVATTLLARIGTRPIIVSGALMSGAGIYWLSRIPLHGSYTADLLVPLVLMALGLGALFVGVQTAANAGVPPEKAGLAAALINTSTQLGIALGLAIASAVATSRTNDLLATHAPRSEALTSGFQRGLVVSAAFLLAAALVALRAANTRAAETPTPALEPVPDAV